MRIKEVDDVEHESSEEQWEAGGRGRVRRKEDHARTQSTTVKRTGKNRTRRRRIFRSTVGADVASREGSERRTVGKLQRETSPRNPYRTTCSRVTKRKGKGCRLFWPERVTRVVLSRKVPRKSTGDWTCRRLMAWRREIGLEFVDIIVKSDNEPALTSLIESQSTLRAMKSGSRMIN